ncbi:MAG: HAD-IB family phosphatase [Ruminococcus sp.]|nr:HAD-IB family phosphatase [Ruminococcus sp.]
MNSYDFDKTIYDGDSTADFYIFSMKKHRKIVTLFPSLLSSAMNFYIFKNGTKTEFKEVMYRFLQYCNTKEDVEEFWKLNEHKIKKFYLTQQKPDDVIISASPEFLLAPICKKLGIKYLIASRVNKKSGKYTGLNCHGEEKVKRFYEIFDKNTVVEEFYSDSYSDTPMAKIAQKAFLVKGEKLSDWNFDKK